MEFIKFAAIVLIGLEYVLLHEIGHYLFAAALGLDPQIVFSFENAASGFLIGVSHAQASFVESGLIILGASFVPLVFIVLTLLYAHSSKRYEFFLIAEIFLIMVIVNMLPIPGLADADANKLFSILFRN